MKPPEHRAFPARLAMLAEMTAFVEGFCQERGLGTDDRLRLTLVVEELFTNTIVHGHRADADAPIHVSLSEEQDDVALLYEDSAPPYNPLAAAPTDPHAITQALESRTIGGLGVLLVRQLVRDARYAYEDGRNRLWLRVPCRSGGSSR